MKVTAIAGGVGGAKLAHGLYKTLDPADLTIIANTGDDFRHLGLYISPDVDTLCYTLADMVNPEAGWGRRDESWKAIEELGRLGGPTWFGLGDRDIATHLERTRRMAQGQTLTAITAHFCQFWGVVAKIIPMSDQPVRTMVETDQGRMSFQEYFVKHRYEPRVASFEFAGIQKASPAAGVLEAIAECDLVVFCPSNPWVSIDPILNVYGMREALAKRPVLAVSPMIGGQAVKGPAAKMFTELGITPSSLAVAEHYGDLLSILVIDESDAVEKSAIERLGIMVAVSNILMKDIDDRQRMASEVIELAETHLLPSSKPSSKEDQI